LQSGNKEKIQGINDSRGKEKKKFEEIKNFSNKK